MMGGNLGLQLGQLVFDATMESVGQATLLTGEDTAKALIEYLTPMQFSASRRVAILFSDARVDSILDDIRRAGMDLLEEEGLALSRQKIEQFQKERYAQYYTATCQDRLSCPSTVLAKTFVNCCAPCEVYSSPFDRGDVLPSDEPVQDISEQLERLDHQIDVFVLGFMGSCPHDEGCTSLPVKVEVEAQPSSGVERAIYMELIAAELYKDLGALTRLTWVVSRGASIAGACALALAAYEIFVGDWFMILFMGVSLLLIGGLANRYRRRLTARTRQRWIRRFSHLDADQLSAFVSELNARHPSLMKKLGL
jgi:hypothetical protein